MTHALTSVIVALNAVANALGSALAPVGLMPGWLSVTLIGALTGVAALVMFKYTSNQPAIRRTRRDIRANLLAVKLFKDNVRVGLRSQIRVFAGAVRLLILALGPIFVMTVPMALLLGQLAAWYQAAPLPVGEETTVTVAFAGAPNEPLPRVELEPDDGFEDLSGPVRVTSQREVCCSIRAKRAGYHRLRFRVGEQVAEKELTVGSGVMRVSSVRPRWNWLAALENPREKPFDRDSVVRSIEVEYPTRSSWTSGTDSWMIYWFLVSLVAGFCFRGVLRVNI